VFVTEIDDEHKEIFAAVGDLQEALSGGALSKPISDLTSQIAAAVHGHFLHEERLMRASRYPSFGWHKRLHDAARKRVRQFIGRLSQGDATAGAELAEYLKAWLHDHTRLADQMLGAFLRNRRLYKMTIQARSKEAEKVDREN
jgi:hemerythrin